MASAAVCGTSSTAASGPASYLQFVAASKARSAWSRKVVRNVTLGGAYSRWPAARDGRVTCRLIARRYRCVAVAVPCQRGKASAQGPAGRQRLT